MRNGICGCHCTSSSDEEQKEIFDILLLLQQLLQQEEDRCSFRCDVVVVAIRATVDACVCKFLGISEQSRGKSRRIISLCRKLRI